MKLAIIVAIGENNVIGKDNSLLWKLSSDMKLFRNLTIGHPIIMGRKTYESIGKPLPGRLNIVITKQKLSVEGIVIANSLEKAIKLAQETNDPEAFVIGGGEIYKLALPLVDKLYVTEVKGNFEGDTFFPKIDLNIWKPSQRLYSEKDEKNDYDFEFVEYSKI
jgi:dihydrofolate reductase